MPIGLLIGPVATLLEDEIYSLPPKACLYTVTTAAGTIEVSNDQSSWTAITLDDNDNFQTAAKFIRVVDDDAIVSIAPYTIQFAGSGGGGGGDVTGPGSSTDNALVLWNGTLGTAVKDSGITIDELISSINAGASQTSFLIQGGQIVWVEDYEFIVTAAVYYIGGILYSSPQTSITLDAADPSDDRIDVIAVTSSGTVVDITGTAAAQPSEPDIDPGTQLKLGIVLVGGGSTEPADASTLVLYEDDAGQPTEWDWTSSGSGWDTSSTNQPIPPATHTIEGTNVAAGAFAQGEVGTPISLASYPLLVLYIKSKATWNNNRGLQLSFRLNGVLFGISVPINRTGSFGFVSSQTSTYQVVAIPTEQFAVGPVQTIDQFRVTGFGGAIGLYIGKVLLQQTGATTVVIGLTQEQADARYRQLTEAVEADMGSSGATRTFDLTNKPVGSFLLTLTANCTLTLTNPMIGGRYLIVVEQDGTGGWTLTISPSPLWANGEAPVVTPDANAVSLITLAYSAVDGGKYLGAANLANS